MRHKIISLIFLVLCTLALCTQQAQAKLVTIEIEAVVDYVEDDFSYLEGKINVGDTITGWYTYDTSTPDSNPLPQVADYQHNTPSCGIFLSVGGFQFETDPTNVDFLVEIINDYTSGGLHDSYGLISYNNLPLSNSALVDGVSWWLRDSSANALSSIDLPTAPPVLGDWQLNRLRMHGERGRYIVDAHVTAAIPEPATVLLIGLGGLFLRKK